MRAVIWFLLLAFAAVGLALAARYNEGYVLLVLPPWRAEVSLNLLILLLLLAFVAVHAMLLAIHHAVNLPRSAAEFRQRRRLEKASIDFREASRLMIEGRYGHAMRCAERAYAHHPEAGMVALVGWHAAHGLRDPERLGVWRTRAYAGGAATEQARLMTEAELALDERRFDDARGALEQLVAEGAGRLRRCVCCCAQSRALATGRPWHAWSNSWRSIASSRPTRRCRFGSEPCVKCCAVWPRIRGPCNVIGTILMRWIVPSRRLHSRPRAR